MMNMRLIIPKEVKSMLIPGDPNIRSYPSLTKKFRKPVAPNKN